MHQPQPRVILEVEPLPESRQPAHVMRRPGVTLVWIDPTALRAQMVWWTRENLRDEERLVLREAFDMDDDLDGIPPDHLLEGAIGDYPENPVPAHLRAPAQELQPVSEP